MNSELAKLMEEILEVPASELDGELPLVDYPVWDSLKHVQLVVGLQSAFSIELERDEIQSLRTMNDISGVLKKRGVDGE